MADERVFSEQEVTQIISRAVEITENAKGYTPGVTESELRRIAEEVGVSPEALAQAIVDSKKPGNVKRGIRLSGEFERVVEGELDPSQFDLVIEGLKAVAKHGPGFAQVGRSLTMNAWTGAGQAQLEVTSRNKRTKLKVRSSALLPGIMTLYPTVMATIISIGALSERGMGALAALVAFVIMTIGSLAFFKFAKTNDEKSEQMADTLRERIAMLVAEQERQSTDSRSTNIEPDLPLQQRLNG